MPTNSFIAGGAYGSRPSGPPAMSTAPQTVPQAISLGNLAYQGLPGYAQSLNNVGNFIQSSTAGQLPEDVVRQIQQRAAERGVSTGSPGSPNTNASYLRDIGLNSLQLQQMGQQSLLNTLPALPGATLSQNPGMYNNPGLQYEADLQRSIFNAAPDPSAAARANMEALHGGYAAGSGAFPSFMPGAGQSNNTAEFMSRPWEAANPGAVGATGYGTGGTYRGGVYYPPGSEPGNAGNVFQNYGGGAAVAGGGGAGGASYFGDYTGDWRNAGQGNDRISQMLDEYSPTSQATGTQDYGDYQDYGGDYFGDFYDFGDSVDYGDYTDYGDEYSNDYGGDYYDDFYF